MVVGLNMDYRGFSNQVRTFLFNYGGFIAIYRTVQRGLDREAKCRIKVGLLPTSNLFSISTESNALKTDKFLTHFSNYLCQELHLQ